MEQTRRSTRATTAATTVPNTSQVVAAAAATASSSRPPNPRAASVVDDDDGVGARWSGDLGITTWAHLVSRRLTRLRALPTVREVRLRTGSTLEINDDVINLEAALAWTAGTVAATPCSRCASNLGRFPQCVVVPGDMGGACANCHFAHDGSACSLHKKRK
jgi:hypothetical protein